VDQIKIGKFIAALRKERSMTQQSLAEKLGVTDRAVSKWENGRGLSDVSFMKSLCGVLGISVDELLNAERAGEGDCAVVNEKNIFNLLNERELEIKKRKNLQKFCFVLVAAVMIMSCVISGKLLTGMISYIIGEGGSVYTAVYTQKAERAARFIVNENYKKAVKHIGFDGQDREKARDIWMENMETLSDEITIEGLEVSDIVYDDHYPIGEYFMTVLDRKSAARYVFDGQITIQDNGIAFGNIYIPAENRDYRRAEVAELIGKAICTWNAG